MSTMSSCVVCSLVVVAGCAGSPAAQPSVISAAPPAIHADACITRSAEQYPPRADSIAITGNAVELCFGKQPKRSCWHLDVATKAFSPLADAPKPIAEPHATATLRPDGGITLCPPARSPGKLLANPSANPHPDWIAVDDDLSTVAIPDTSGSTMRLFDVATGRTRTTIKGWADSPMAGDAFNSPPTFATPDRMIVWYAWTPVSEQGRIFEPSGKQLAIIGHDFWSIDPAKSSWHLAGTEWAIKGEGNTIATVDVRDAELTSIYDVSALRALPRPPPDSDTGILDVLAIAGGADRLIIVTGENPVTIGVLERPTKQLLKLDPPRCPR
jgi:hypothetical protein